MTTFALEKPMTFVGGKAVFFSKNKQCVCWPIGAPKQIVVNGDLVTTSGAPAHFENHLWRTDLKDYAAGMVKSPHLGDPHGIEVDPSCLPLPVLKMWKGLTIDEKRAVCLALINSMDPDEAVKNIEPRYETEQDEAAVPNTYICPVCNLSIEGETDPARANAALLTHQRIVHPDWAG